MVHPLHHQSISEQRLHKVFNAVDNGVGLHPRKCIKISIMYMMENYVCHLEKQCSII